jgi:hypothetical protein
VAVPEALDKKGFGASASSTSEFMLLDGPTSVYREYQVNVVFPESNGAVDASTEDWSQTDLTTMIVAISRGLVWWEQRYAPARLKTVLATTWEVPTPWEPISHPHTFEATWVNALMETLDVSGSDYFRKVRRFNNTYLVSAATTWSSTLFVVNSKVDADGRFADPGPEVNRWFDYSYFGGPFFVMTWDNGPWGNANTDYLCAHETGHQFYARDEYATSGCTDTETSGYLSVANGNCENGGGSSVACIMRNNNRSEFTNGDVCAFTRDAIGWRDVDADSIPDIVDHPPLLTLDDYGSPTTCDSTPTLTGSVAPEVENNVNPASFGSGSSANEDISVNAITSVEYRVGGGAWLLASPDDGAWDEAGESFQVTAALPGSNVATAIEVRATNSRGLVSAVATDTLTLRDVCHYDWVDGFEDADVADWTIVNTGATVALDNSAGSWSLQVIGASGPGLGASATSPPIAGAPAPFVDVNEPYTVSFRFRWTSFHWCQWVVLGHVRLLIDQPWLPIKFDPNGNWTGLANLGSRFDGYVPAGTWKTVDVSVVPAARQYTVAIDGVTLGTANYAASLVPAPALSFYENSGSTNYMNAWYDDFHVAGTPSPTGVAAVDPPRDGEFSPATRGAAIWIAPNPFRSETTIRYDLASRSDVSLRIYRADGSLVRTLARDVRPAGPQEIRWDGRGDRGTDVPSGIYFVELLAPQRRDVDRVVLLR